MKNAKTPEETQRRMEACRGLTIFRDGNEYMIVGKTASNALMVDAVREDGTRIALYATDVARFTTRAARSRARAA